MHRGSQNPRYMRIATVLRKEIMDGDFPSGTMFLVRDIAERFEAGTNGESVSNALAILKREGLVEARRVEGATGRGSLRYFIRSSESLHGGPERR